MVLASGSLPGIAVRRPQPPPEKAPTATVGATCVRDTHTHTEEIDYFIAK